MTTGELSRSVAKGEYGLVRVFSSNNTEDITVENIASLLGPGVHLDQSKVEVIDSSSISAIGLTTYLVEGYGIDRNEIATESKRLDSIEGTLILVPSSAFQGTAQNLILNPKIDAVDVFREAEAEPPSVMAIREGAKGFAAPFGSKDEDKHSLSRTFRSAIILFALLVSATIVLSLVTGES